MAKEATTNRKELSLEEVFDFNSSDVSMDDLRTALQAVTTDLHQYMKWFKVLSKDYSLAQSEKEKMQKELETTLKSVTSFSDLEKENNSLKLKLEEQLQKELTLVSKIKDLEKTISVWNKSSTSIETILANQRPASVISSTVRLCKVVAARIVI